jgi:hypothetical protein
MSSTLINLWWNPSKTLEKTYKYHWKFKLNGGGRKREKKGEKYWENTLVMKVYKPNIRFFHLWKGNKFAETKLYKEKQIKAIVILGVWKYIS